MIGINKSVSHCFIQSIADCNRGILSINIITLIKASRKECSMGHFSDDQNKDEFMNASAEDWSKPSTPAERPTVKPEPTDRWGSPVPDKTTASDPGRWGSEAPPVSTPGVTTKKTGSKWWIILIVVLVVLCLCACLVIFGLPALGLSLIPTDFLQF
jgi:hypothetical protein